jgi:hypothetical protein
MAGVTGASVEQRERIADSNRRLSHLFSVTVPYVTGSTMRTAVGPPSARVSELKSATRRVGTEACDGPSASRPSLGPKPAGPGRTRSTYPGIGPLVCTVGTTAEPGVLRRLLHAIMGLNSEHSPGALTRSVPDSPS